MVDSARHDDWNVDEDSENLQVGYLISCLLVCVEVLDRESQDQEQRGLYDCCVS
jgi:hypothetical protein